jgi:phage baseplate assembly protein W
MAIDPKRFGTDLKLLNHIDVPDVRPKSTRDPPNDLFTRIRVETNQPDLDIYSDVNNLVQALFLRFLTPVGEMEPLGHPDYGSRLSELIGELNNETNRNRAKLFTLQALQAEPRIKEIRSVDVTQNRADRTIMDIKISVLPVDSDTLLNLVFPFFL